MRLLTPPTLEVESVHSPESAAAETTTSLAAEAARRPTEVSPSEAPGFACPVRSALAVFHDLDGLLRSRPPRVFTG